MFRAEDRRVPRRGVAWREATRGRAPRLARDVDRRPRPGRPRPRGIPHAPLPERGRGGVRAAGGQGAKPARGGGAPGRPADRGNEVFSFWRHVGRPTRGRGFADGRELREGCIVPSVGGGFCQLSNALYAAALDAGCEIVERHAHSRRVPGSMAEAGRDATVFWNYVDLRFRPPDGLPPGDPPHPARTRRPPARACPGGSDGDHLRASCPHASSPAAALPAVESCETCEDRDLFPPSRAAGRRTGGRHRLAGGCVVAGVRPLPARAPSSGRPAVFAARRPAVPAARVPLGDGRVRRRAAGSLGDAPAFLEIPPAGRAGRATAARLAGTRRGARGTFRARRAGEAHCTSSSARRCSRTCGARECSADAPSTC